MEEEKKDTKKFLTKERIVPAIVGAIIGIVLTCLVAFLFDYFAKSAGIARIKYGEEVMSTVDGKSISAQEFFNQAKKTNGLNILLGEVDKLIFNNMYELTEEDEEEIKTEAKNYLEYYESYYGYSQEKFLETYGFSTYEDFLDDLRMNKKSNKYVYDYLEGLLEPGAVQKYYDENKDTIETYDSEHILVRISDTVTDEQALALANEIITKLNEGKTFADIKEEYGDRIVHEELGYQGKTASLEQTYIDELVALEDGAYSKTPIKTSYGYHIVHRLATATLEDLRETIIETLSEEVLSADEKFVDKIFIKLREEKNLAIFDEELKKQYEDYCNTVNSEEE